MDGVIKALMNRKSIRSFTGEAVDKESVDILLKAAMAAPSAMNSQPWVYIVVDDAATKDALADKLPYAKMLKSAGVGIVICGDLSRALPSPMTDFWIQDCSAATENLLLAAEALGLGAVWTGVHPNPAAINAVRSVIDLPENIIPFCVIPVGHPAANPAPKDKYDASKVHWNNW
ncbi:MAG: nitroreductase family protein [Proteobacteria bacterium]|nr:nitroreductase family protein [Pseudomonadota bacterium]